MLLACKYRLMPRGLPRICTSEANSYNTSGLCTEDTFRDSFFEAHIDNARILQGGSLLAHVNIFHTVSCLEYPRVESSREKEVPVAPRIFFDPRALKSF